MTDFEKLRSNDSDLNTCRCARGVPSTLAGLLVAAACSCAVMMSPDVSMAERLTDASSLTEPASKALENDPDVQAAMRFSRAFEKIAKAVTPAVVNITATKGGEVVDNSKRGQQPQRRMDPQEEFMRRFFGEQFGGADPFGGGGGPQQTPQSTSFGSGVIVTADGYVLTNNHVVEGARSVKVTLANNRNFDAKVIGADAATDIAVLKLDGQNFAHIPLGNSDNVNIGETVLAIGNPFQLSHTVTSGIISAKGRQIDNGQQRSMRYEDFLQTDAAVNPGNSGGPLVNLKGEVIGINTAIFSRSGGYMGISFAIPSNLAQGVMDQLVSTGKVSRGWLGVGVQTLDENTAKSLGLDETKGVVITAVTEGGPADGAGVKAEDVVVEINGRATPNADALRTVVATLGPGKTVPIKLYRGAEQRTIEVKLGDAAQAMVAQGTIPAESNKLGLSLTELTPEVIREMRLDRRTRGLLVKEVAAGSLAEQVGMQPDDILVQLSGQQLTDANSFQQAMKLAEQRGSARLVVRRGRTDLIATVMLARN